MNPIDIDAAIDAAPDFKKSAKINHFNRYLIEIVVQELAKSGAAIRASSKLKTALKSAAKGRSRAQWSRRLRIKSGSPLSNVILALAEQLEPGHAGRKPTTTAAKCLHDTLKAMRRAEPDGKDAARLLTLPGQPGLAGSRGSRKLDLTNSETARLVAQHATAWGVDEEHAAQVINAARLALFDALKNQFGSVAARKALENARRSRRRKA